MKTIFPKLNLIVYSFTLLLFTFCEQKTTTVTDETVVTDEKVVTVTDSTTTTHEVDGIDGVDRVDGVDREDKREFKKRVEAENEELKDKIARLREKAKAKGKNAGNDIEQAIDKLERERVEFKDDGTDNKVEEKWKKLKGKISAAADSIDKKF